MLHTVIMAGGGGTRFWPRSRARKPKQFLNLVGERSLLQQAYDRIAAQSPPQGIWVITSAQHIDMVAQQLPEVPADHIVGEPCGRDTAACIGLGAALIARTDPEATILVMPADHVIEPVQTFRQAVHVAEAMVKEHPSALVTFGIQPTFPATGYGYIRRAEEIAQRQGVVVHRVRNFREKPSREVAEEFLTSGDYFWNSGLFAWQASTILQHLAQRQPALVEAVERIAAAWPTAQRSAVFQREYEPLAKISIDFAVMEHAPQVLMVRAPFGWDDVGSWLALERMQPQDADGNTVQALHCGLKTKDCIVVADSGQLVATIGVEHLLIVQDGNAILIADKRDEAGIKQLVELLKKKGLDSYL